MDQQHRFAPDVVIRWNTQQVSAEIDGEVVVMDVADGKYIGFNDIASAVWRGLESSPTVAALCEKLTHDFEGDPEAIRKDVVELLVRLDELGLIELGAAPPPTDA